MKHNTRNYSISPVSLECYNPCQKFLTIVNKRALVSKNTTSRCREFLELKVKAKQFKGEDRRNAANIPTHALVRFMIGQMAFHHGDHLGASEHAQ